MNVGAHLSVAGGLAKAFERARAETATALQIFTRNQRQWSAKPLDPDAVRAFRAARQESSVGTVVSHASYLVNLATPDDALWERSVATLTDELDRAIALGLDGVVFHPGAHMGSGVDAGLSRIATGVRRVLAAREGASAASSSRRRWARARSSAAASRRSRASSRRAGPERASASASTRVTCSRPDTTSERPPPIGERDATSIRSWGWATSPSST